MTRTLSLSPLFGTTVGFDRFDDLLDSLARGTEADDGRPPYNIERVGEDAYVVTLAVAGFAPSELSVSVQDNVLVVTGERKPPETSGSHYLYRGFGVGNFRQTFRLADYVVVRQAALKDGLLRIDLAREVPEAQKPRRIEIRTRPNLEIVQPPRQVA